jgi:PTS system nitrogen regulatory IIA component
MDAGRLLTPSCILPNLKAGNKKDLLRQLAEVIAPSLSLDSQIIFEALLQRERLGTTGLGSGIAIPHARLPGLERMSGFFIRLEKGIDFHAVDKEPVDLIFALFAPADAGADHLDALVSVSRLLREEEITRQLREAKDAKALYGLLTRPAHQYAA